MAVRSAVGEDTLLDDTGGANGGRAAGAGNLPARGNTAHWTDGDRVSRPSPGMVGTIGRMAVAVGNRMAGDFLGRALFSGIHFE